MIFHYVLALVISMLVGFAAMEFMQFVGIMVRKQGEVFQSWKLAYKVAIIVFLSFMLHFF